MSSIPEAKLDVLLAHHASLEAESLGQLASERYVQITRELAEITPLIELVKAYRSAVKELADTEALIADPEHTWSDAFGVGRFLGTADERVSFLIDASGRIVKVYEDVDPGVHANQVLADAKALGLTSS